MSSIHYDRFQLADLLPHRGLNLLIDQVDVDQAGNTSVSHTTLTDDDDRTLFTRTNAAGQRFWYEPYLGEIAAVTGLPFIAERIAPGVGVYSKVSKCAFHRPAPIGQDLRCDARITRSRADFNVFVASISSNDDLVMETEVMSGTAMLDAIASVPVRPFTEPVQAPVSSDLLAWKPKPMRSINGIRSWDAGTNTLEADYVYPEDHPCVPGHFPNAPLMMGMAQWAMVADAGWLARDRAGISGAVSVSGQVTHVDGAQVLDVRDLVLTPDDAGLPWFTSTKRLAFRDPVRPGDGLIISVTVQPC